MIKIIDRICKKKPKIKMIIYIQYVQKGEIKGNHIRVKLNMIKKMVNYLYMKNAIIKIINI